MPNRRPILIVEDDETLRNMLTEYLDETREFVVSTAADSMLPTRSSPTKTRISMR